MTGTRIGRRDLIRALGTTALLGPFLRPLRALADVRPPKRLFVFYTPNGTVPHFWTPHGSETGFILPRILEPLEPFRSRLLVLDGIDLLCATRGLRPGPHFTTAHLLTGTELRPGRFEGGGVGGSGWAGGISIDQHVAAAVGSETPLRSLELAVRRGPSDPRGTLSYAGADQPLPMEDDARRVWRRLTGALGGDVAASGERRDRDSSVLDRVREEIVRLSRQASPEDRPRIEQHLYGVRELERRLHTPAVPTSSCEPPSSPPAPTHRFDEDGRTMIDLAVLALACGLTRVVTFYWCRSTTYPFLGIPEDHHALSHERDENAVAQEKLVRINRWYAEELARLAASLDAVPEGDGTLLDHTAILWCSEVGIGNRHSRRNLPFLLLGGAGGYFRTGRTLRLGETAHNALLVSLANAMDVPTRTFGDPAYGSGELDALR